jgi:hypothetical protein
MPLSNPVSCRSLLAGNSYSGHLSCSIGWACLQRYCPVPLQAGLGHCPGPLIKAIQVLLMLWPALWSNMRIQRKPRVVACFTFPEARVLWSLIHDQASSAYRKCQKNILTVKSSILPGASALKCSSFIHEWCMSWGMLVTESQYRSWRYHDERGDNQSGSSIEVRLS